MPFWIHPPYLHEHSIIAENKQSSFCWTLGLDPALEAETGLQPTSNTLRLTIIWIINLIHRKSVVWGWKALFRLRAHQVGSQVFDASLCIESISQREWQETGMKTVPPSLKHRTISHQRWRSGHMVPFSPPTCPGMSSTTFPLSTPQWGYGEQVSLK